MAEKKSDEDIVQSVLERTTALQTKYHDLHERWYNDLSFYYGTPRTATKKERNQPKFNILRGDVEVHTANFIGSQPEMFVRAFEEADDAGAEMLTNVIHADWDASGAREAFRRVCKTASQIGTGFLRIGFDQPNGPANVGKIKYWWLNPFEVLIDPDAFTLWDARYAIIVRYITVQEACRQFPDLKTKIVALETAKLEEEEPGAIIKQLAGMPANEFGDKKLTGDEDSKRIQYAELWNDGGKSLTRVLGDILVSEERSPYDHGMFPFVPVTALEDIFSPYGVSDVFDARDTQLQHTKVMRAALYNLDTAQKILNKVYVVADPSGTGKVTSQVKGDQFAVVPVETMEQMPACVNADSLVNYIQMLLKMSGAISQEKQETGGATEAMKGLREAGVYSGRHQMALAAQGEQRFGPRLDALICNMKRVGRINLSLIQQYYTDKLHARSFRLGEAVDAKRFKTHDENGDPLLPRLKNPDKDFPLEDPRFEVYVQPQDEYPMSRQAQSQFLAQAMQYGGANVESVMTVARVPQARKMLTKMGEQIVGGMDPTQPIPEDVVRSKAALGRKVIELNALQTEVGIQTAQLQAIQQQGALEQIAMQVMQMVQQGMSMPEAMGQFGLEMPQQGGGQQFGQPRGGIRTAGPGQMAEPAQDQAEAQNMSIGQPPGPQGY